MKTRVEIEIKDEHFEKWKEARAKLASSIALYASNGNGTSIPSLSKKGTADALMEDMGRIVYLHFLDRYNRDGSK